MAFDQRKSSPIPVLCVSILSSKEQEKNSGIVAQSVKAEGKQIKAPNGDEVEIHTFQLCIQSYLPA